MVHTVVGALEGGDAGAGNPRSILARLEPGARDPARRPGGTEPVPGATAWSARGGSTAPLSTPAFEAFSPPALALVGRGRGHVTGGGTGAPTPFSASAVRSRLAGGDIGAGGLAHAVTTLVQGAEVPITRRFIAPTVPGAGDAARPRTVTTVPPPAGPESSRP